MKNLHVARMPRVFYKRIILPASPLLYLSVMSLLVFALRAGTVERQMLRGHLPAEVARLKPLGHLEGTHHLNLTISLPLRNRAALEDFIRQVSDPSSPEFRKYLTADEFTQRYGPTVSDYQAVKDFLNDNGLRVVGTHPNRTLIDVSGSASDVERTFNLKLHTYQHPTESRTFFAPDTEPLLALQVPVLKVGGLDDFASARPMSLRVIPAGKPGGAVPDATPIASGSGPNGTFLGQDFRPAYAPRVAFNGAGQSVGLFELDGYFLSDVIEYASLSGLPRVPLTNVLINGYNGNPRGANIEVALDIDMAVAMAPGLSRIIVYEGRTSNDANDVFNRMATDNLSRQLSSSWGFTGAVNPDPTRDQIFLQFAAQGQTMFQASGDAGASPSSLVPPSDNPYITVVGGTALTTTGAGGSWVSETTWPGSAGGSSTVYAIPWWQRGVNVSSNQGSAVMRNVPDLACQADGTLWIIYNNGQQGRVAGTSAAAPLWAGFAALINQQASANSIPSIGFIPPAVYAAGKSLSASAFLHDITIGNTTNSGSPNAYFATKGYDLCTGWGTPSGSNTISALLSPVGSLRITPSTGLVFSGPVGGPFSPAAQTYTLTNSGTVAFNWTLAISAPWLSVTPTNGALTPGGSSATNTIGLYSLASTFSAGSYSANIRYTNLDDQVVQSRAVILNVIAPPQITKQPSDQVVYPGMTASFNVGVSTNGSLFYQWQQDNGSYLTNLTDGGNISGSATATLTITNVSSANLGAYSVVVSNAAGVVTSSNAFVAIVPWRPVLTLQPVSQTVLPEQTVMLTVAAVGSPPLSYVWQQNGTNLSDGGRISGSQTGTLTIRNASAASAGSYMAAISNANGVTLSSNAVLTVPSVTSSGVTMTMLHSFNGGSEGSNPNGLLQVPNGNFYGTTQAGGSNSFGTIFQMRSDGTLASLHSFAGQPDGGYPQSALIQWTDGSLFGTTYSGGTNGFGTAFRTDTNGNLVSVVTPTLPDGLLFYSGLVQGGDGNFYGTTYEGGVNTWYGTVFRMTPAGALTTLYSFSDGNDGGFVYAGLAHGVDGGYYGTTVKGGSGGFGAVFRITTNGALTTLAAFYRTNGSFPYAGVAPGADGSLYGVTSAGGAYGLGTIFSVSQSGLLTDLYSFTGASDGTNPVAALFPSSDGNYYGTTSGGGTYGAGTVFRVSPDGTFATLAQFEGYNGSTPQAALIQGSDGSLYGTTAHGGAVGAGATFKLTFSGTPQITGQPASQTVFESESVTFSAAAFGSFPMAFRWRRDGTNLSDGGNISGSATPILTLTNVALADAAGYSVVAQNPQGSGFSGVATLQVVSSPPVFVQQPVSQSLAPGASATFTVSAQGSVPITYHWQKNGTNLNNVHNVAGSTTTTLTLSNVLESDSGIYTAIASNFLASVASTGAVLSVIPFSAPGTLLTTLHPFTGGSDGGTPNGLAPGADGALYGTTQSGGSCGSSGYGSVFSLTTNGLFTTLASFCSSNGALPMAALVQGADRSFYGTTELGGSNNFGTVFKFATNWSVQTLYSFAGAADGANPVTSLTPGADGFFYGVASAGGGGGYGNVFKVTSAGSLTPLYSFTNGTDGSFPSNALTLGADGVFYGMTASGGAYRNGNVFKMTPSGALSNLYSFTGAADGYAPAGALVQDSDGTFYGVTTHNTFRGFQFYGTIFKITPAGALTTLYTLNAYDGHNPVAGLIEASDGNFYGTTYTDAVSQNGVVFMISRDGAFENLVAFDGFDGGAHPASALVQGADGALYGTTTTGGPGGQGTVFRLSFTGSPQITSQPASLTAGAGGNATFSVAVFGAPPLFYRWQKGGTNLADGGAIAGSASRTISLSNISTANAGAYSVVVSNILGSVISASAQLTVLAPPVFQSVMHTNSSILLSWSTSSGQKYQLQYKPGLSAATWTNLGAAITATGATWSVTDAIGTNSQRFYRVALQF